MPVWFSGGPSGTVRLSRLSPRREGVPAPKAWSAFSELTSFRQSPFWPAGRAANATGVNDVLDGGLVKTTSTDRSRARETDRNSNL
jgi:hypothetical protein